MRFRNAPFSKHSVFIEENASKAHRPHFRFRSVFPVHTKICSKTIENAATYAHARGDLNDVSVFESLRFHRPH